MSQFKTNIEQEIALNDNPEGARYECIYKNLLRDIRQHFAARFDAFLKQTIEREATEYQIGK